MPLLRYGYLSYSICLEIIKKNYLGVSRGFRVIAISNFQNLVCFISIFSNCAWTRWHRVIRVVLFSKILEYCLILLQTSQNLLSIGKKARGIHFHHQILPSFNSYHSKFIPNAKVNEIWLSSNLQNLTFIHICYNFFANLMVAMYSSCNFT